MSAHSLDASNRPGTADAVSAPAVVYVEPGSGDTGAVNFFDLTFVRGVLYRQRYVMLGCVAALLLLGFVASLLMTPRFEAAATIVVDPYDQQIVEGQNVEREKSSMDVYPFMTTLGEIITSQRLARSVYDAMGAADRRKVLEKLPDDFAAGQNAREKEESLRVAGARALAGMVEAKVPLDSRVMTITVTSTDAALAAKLANLYADNIAMEDLRRTSEANSYAQRYLLEQIALVRGKLFASERSANDYAMANNIVAQTAAPAKDKSEIVGETVAVSTLKSVNDAFNEARTNRIEAQQRWSAIAGVPAAQVPQALGDTAIQTLVGKLGEAQAKLADLRVRYGDQHPQVQEARAQVAALDGQISRQSAAIKNGVRIEYEAAQRQEAALAQELGRASGGAMGEQNRRVAFNQLTRETDALSNQLDALLTRYNELAAAANLRNSSVTKLDAAQTPGSPVSPNLLKNLLVALIAGLGLGVAASVLREALDDRLRSLEDVEAKLGMPLLGQTPAVSREHLNDESSDEYAVLMEAYSSIRAVLDSTLPRGHNVIQVTSSQPAEGKSITAAALARKTAMIGRKVLLVDADLRRPSIAAQFGLRRKAQGTAEVLLGNATLAEASAHVDIPNLTVLPVGTIPPNPVELLSSGAVEAFIAAHRDQFDLIIFDSSPVIGLADSLRLSHAVDGTIFIAEANRAHYGQIKAAVRQLRSAGANIVGVVLSKYRALDAGQYYAYQYEYYTYGDKRAA